MQYVVFKLIFWLYRSRRMKPIVVDPGLYLSEINPMFYATQKRELPDAYQLFSGMFDSSLHFDLSSCNNVIIFL